MEKRDLVVIYATFGNLEAVAATLPSVARACDRPAYQLIVHDSTTGDSRDEKWSYLQQLSAEYGFFLMLTSQVSMAHARNLALSLAVEQFAPDVVAMMEDDHGLQHDALERLSEAILRWYGRPTANGLHAGMFTLCQSHNRGSMLELDEERSCWVRSVDERPGRVGGANSCFRAAPLSHWLSVLRGYDTDEYPISTYQTRGINERNYHKGFTSVIVGDGSLCFEVAAEGRGTSAIGLPLWDEEYTASDQRSRYRGKPGTEEGVVDRIRAGRDKAKQTAKRLMR